MTIRLTILFFFALFQPSLDLMAKGNDSLVSKSYDYIYDRIDINSGKKSVFRYLNAYLDKAKKEDNIEEIINGYNNYIYEVDYSQMLVYTDSMIYAAERTDSNELIGSAILTKGIVYYNHKEHNKALDYYLIANRLLASTDNDYLKYKTQYNIGHIKYYLGFYNDAISLFNVCLEYFREEDTLAYLNCLHSLALCNTKLGNYQESGEINRFALAEGERLKDSSMIHYIDHSEGINEYFRKSYGKAIIKIQSAIPHLQKKKDFGNLSVAYFYIASSYWELGKRELAVKYLLMVDQIFTDKKYIRPDLRRNYELLIDYYKSKGNRDAELLYVTRLLQADRILHSNFKYLSGRVLKEYDTTELINAKNKIERDFIRERVLRIGLLITAILFVPFTIYLIYRNGKLRQYSKNFERYKNKLSETEEIGSSKSQRPNIPEELENALLAKLQKFEDTYGYIKKDLRIEKLAITFGTNYKYLSQVINYHKGKSYPDYISDLRLAYIARKLEKDQKLRNYTYTAIAAECGFGTAQQFTDVFKKKMGMPFSFFLDELTKIN